MPGTATTTTADTSSIRLGGVTGSRERPVKTLDDPRQLGNREEGEPVRGERHR